MRASTITQHANVEQTRPNACIAPAEERGPSHLDPMAQAISLEGMRRRAALASRTMRHDTQALANEVWEQAEMLAAMTRQIRQKRYYWILRASA